MCLSIPAQVVDINDDIADVSVGGAIFKASLQLVENIEVGDWVLLHTGFAISKINEEEALETLKIFREIEDVTGK
jgi:hydrogenase expression/formation protein HypC